MPNAAPFRPCSPGTIIPETEYATSSLDQDDIPNYRLPYPTSESNLLDEDGIGRQRTGVEVYLNARIGETPRRLDSVSERLQRLENKHNGNGESDAQPMDISETGPSIEHETDNPCAKDDTPTLDVALQLVKEVSKCIRELRVMYQIMLENHENRKREDAVRLTAYNEILHSLNTLNPY